MASPLETAVLATSPQTYLMLDESTGPAASDASGNGHAGVYQGMRLAVVAGVPGGSAVAPSCFPATNTPPLHEITLSAGNVDYARASVMVWFHNHVSSFSQSEVIASATRSSTEGWFLQCNSSDQLLHFGVGTTGGFVTITDPRGLAAYNDGLWHMAVGTKDGFSQVTQLYVDGVLVAQSSGLSPLSIDTGGGAIGGLEPINSTQPYTAEPSNFALWNRVLTSAEVLSIWTAGGAARATPGNIGGAINVNLAPITAALATLQADCTALQADVTTIKNRQEFYDQYTFGTLHTGLSGNGQVSTLGCLGIITEVTTLPAFLGTRSGDPQFYFDVGFITWGDTNGFVATQRITLNPQVFIPIDTSSTIIAYTLTPGVVMNIQELVRAN